MIAKRRMSLAALAVTGLLAACGGSNPDTDTAVSGVGGENVGSVTQSADCADWNAGTEEERQATLVDLRGQLTSQTDAAAQSILSDDRAYELFENACEEEYAQSLRLYKIYVRAAAFEPLQEP